MMADPSATPIEATTRPDAGRLFAALELRKSRWLVTSTRPAAIRCRGMPSRPAMALLCSPSWRG